MIKNKSIDYIFGMITGVLLVFTISCNQPQTKTVDEKVEEMKKKASNVPDKPKEEITEKASNIVEKHKVVQKPKTYKTTDYDSRLLKDPNGNNLLIRIPKDTKLEIIDKEKLKINTLFGENTNIHVLDQYEHLYINIDE